MDSGDGLSVSALHLQKIDCELPAGGVSCRDLRQRFHDFLHSGWRVYIPGESDASPAAARPTASTRLPVSENDRRRHATLHDDAARSRRPQTCNPPAGGAGEVLPRDCDALLQEPPVACRAEDGDHCSGERVLITGLPGRPELNGQVGTLVKHDPAEGRWRVRMDGGLHLSLRSDTFRATGTGQHLPVNLETA